MIKKRIAYPDLNLGLYFVTQSTDGKFHLVNYNSLEFQERYSYGTDIIIYNSTEKDCNEFIENYRDLGMENIESGFEELYNYSNKIKHLKFCMQVEKGFSTWCVLRLSNGALQPYSTNDITYKELTESGAEVVFKGKRHLCLDYIDENQDFETPEIELNEQED